MPLREHERQVRLSNGTFWQDQIEGQLELELDLEGDPDAAYERFRDED